MRKLANTSNEDLIATMTTIRKSEIKNAADILIHIDEVSHRKLHLKLGYSSIYKFLFEKFRYSKDEAYPRMRAAQALAIDPALEEDLRQNRICTTYLMQAQVAFIREDKRRQKTKLPKLTNEAKKETLKKIVENREAKRTLATAFPQLQKDYNREKPVTEDLTVYQFALNKEGSEKLQKLKEQYSHAVPDGNLSDLIAHLIDCQLKKPTKTKPANETKTTNQRKYISIHTKRALLENATHQCQHQHDGQRCTETFGLQIDHIRPIALGGTDSYENLRILCRQHNRYAADLHGLSFKTKTQNPEQERSL